MVVLAAELEVAQHNCDLRTCDEQNDEHEAQEAEEVVELMEPHRGQDEEELYEDGAKGQDASYEDAEDWVHVPTNNKLCHPRALSTLSWD